MGHIDKKVKGVTVHLEPLADGRVRYIFAIDGQILEEETLSKSELRSRFPSIGLQILGHLGGDDGISNGARKIGQIMSILGGMGSPRSSKRRRRR